MGNIPSSRTLFFTTSPRSPQKLIPEIALLNRLYEGQIWRGKDGVQSDFAKSLSEEESFLGLTSKKYTTLSARDRITRAPQGLGFVDLYPRIKLSEPGSEFVYGTRSSEIFLRQLIKFQLPSPYHKETKRIKGTFWVHPYLEITRMIRELEYLTPDEFKIFALQITDYRKFDSIKEKVIRFRKEITKNKGRYKQFVREVFHNELLEIYHEEISTGNIQTRESATTTLKDYLRKKRNNMRDYSDACFRYLRFTELFSTDGKSICIDPNKMQEVDHILSTAEREPVFVDDINAYKTHLFDNTTPVLFTDIRENVENTLMRISSYTRRDLSEKSISELKAMRDFIIREKREVVIHEQKELLKSYALYQEVMDTYNEIITEDVYDAPLFLEWNTWRAMTMLDGGEIKGNFKIDDSGKPISTALGNMPDIECDYGDFALSVEVTLSSGQRQYDAEGESVTRHYAQLKQRVGKDTYCLFVARKVSAASWAHFFGINQINNISAYGGKPQIIPLDLDQFMRLIENSYSYHEKPSPSEVRSFLQYAIDQVVESRDENDWKIRVQTCVESWLAA